jgi:hypothetical protein
MISLRKFCHCAIIDSSGTNRNARNVITGPSSHYNVLIKKDWAWVFETQPEIQQQYVHNYGYCKYWQEYWEIFETTLGVYY